jgi:peptidoglycan L-alanyl-D-glutamate endopeptidase CwlK
VSFRFGAKSEANLVGIHPDLVRVVRLALTLSDIDFSVFEGLRTMERQRKLVATGASRRLDSYHLTGDAVDLVPWVDGDPRWEHALCNQVAVAMREAAERLEVRLVWGRVWDMELHELDENALEAERALYVRRYQRLHGREKWPLDDGPHFERVRT